MFNKHEISSKSNERNNKMRQKMGVPKILKKVSKSLELLIGYVYNVTEIF